MDSQIVIHTKAKQLVAAASTAVAALVIVMGGFWGVNALVFGDTKEDVREIRAILQKLADEDATLSRLMSGADAELRKEIYDIGKATERNGQLLQTISVDIADIKTDIRGLRGDMVELIKAVRK